MSQRFPIAVLAATLALGAAFAQSETTPDASPDVSPDTTAGADADATADATSRDRTGTGGMQDTSRTGASAPGSLAAADRRFVEQAAKSGMLEVELGQLAASQGESAEVRRYGERLVDDHREANQELKSIAQRVGVAVPANLDQKHRTKIEKLRGLSGAKFDREFMRIMNAQHQKDIKQFQEQARSGQNPELRAFAAKTLPVLQEHHRMAHAISPAGRDERTGAPPGEMHGPMHGGDAPNDGTTNRDDTSPDDTSDR